MMNPSEFEAALRAVGKDKYHHLHPFHVRMNEGKLSKEHIRVWVANRFYYQRNIPIKDAAIVSNCPHRDIRRQWLHRITDHDGRTGAEGGLEAWLRLAEGCGLDREKVLAGEGLLPGVRFAVDAYVTFARTQPWPVAIASSLTEMFAPDIMAKRLEAFPRHYPWIPDWAYDYFRSRVTQARIDSGEGLALTIRWCNTPELQQQAVDALNLKCDILWSLLDAIDAHAP
jgi:pyrroloquinoline-quinone synthase